MKWPILKQQHFQFSTIIHSILFVLLFYHFSFWRISHQQWITSFPLVYRQQSFFFFQLVKNKSRRTLEKQNNFQTVHFPCCYCSFRLFSSTSKPVLLLSVQWDIFSRFWFFRLLFFVCLFACFFCSFILTTNMIS